MKRSTFDGERCLPLRLPALADLDEAGLRQLRLAHNLWNELVAGELQHEETVRQLWHSIPSGRDPRSGDRRRRALTKLLERTKSEHVKDRSTGRGSRQSRRRRGTSGAA